MPETNFFWDPLSDNILQERDETGVVTAEYTTEPGLYGNLVSQNRGGVESQYHFDALGSTLALTDNNQQVTDTYAYTAFGEVTEDTGSTANPFQYIGQKGYYKDEVTGEYSVRRRPLSPGSERWLTVDPIGGLSGDVNLYRYDANGPVRVADPSGLASDACAPSACDAADEIYIKGAFNKAVRIIDVELKDNIKSIKSEGGRRSFVKNDPLVEVEKKPKGFVTIWERETWKVECCVDKATKSVARVLKNEKSGASVETNKESAVPDKFELTRGNMRQFADFAWGPPPSWFYSCGKADDATCACLKAAGPAMFSARQIKSDSTIPGYQPPK